MPRWLALTIAEARRTRQLSGVARRQPLLPVIAAAGAATALWLSWRGGVVLGGLLARAPAGLFPVNALLLWLGACFGAASSLMAPRLAQHDEQIRLVPLPPVAAFLGATALPLLATWLLASIPVLVLVAPIDRALPVGPAAAWTVAFEVAFVAACAMGATLAETGRWFWFERTARRAARPLAVVACAALVAVAPALASGRPWWGLHAALLPRADWPVGPVAALPAASALAAAGVCAAAAFAVWLLSGGVAPRPRFAGGGRWRLPRSWRSRPSLLAWWAVAALLREPRMWLTAAFTLCSAAFFVLADRMIGHGTHAFAQFAPLVAVMGGAQVALFLSERLGDSGWFWRLVPARAHVPGLWWWAGAATLAAAVSVPALVAPGVVGQLGGATGVVVFAASCFGAAAVGRALPWDSRSQGQQTATTVLYCLALFAAAAGFDWLASHISVAAGVATLVVACAVVSAVLCVRLPWRTSWRAT